MATARPVGTRIRSSRRVMGAQSTDMNTATSKGTKMARAACIP